VSLIDGRIFAQCLLNTSLPIDDFSSSEDHFGLSGEALPHMGLNTGHRSKLKRVLGARESQILPSSSFLSDDLSS
jgi:hypothetical protein